MILALRFNKILMLTSNRLIIELNPKYVQSTDVKKYEGPLLLAIRTSKRDIKPGGSLSDFRWHRLMSFSVSLPHLIFTTHAIHHIQLSLTSPIYLYILQCGPAKWCKNRKNGHNFASIRSKACPKAKSAERFTRHIQLTINRHKINAECVFATGKEEFCHSTFAVSRIHKLQPCSGSRLNGPYTGTWTQLEVLTWPFISWLERSPLKGAYDRTWTKDTKTQKYPIHTHRIVG